MFLTTADTLGKKPQITQMLPSVAQRVAVAPFSRDLLRSRFGVVFGLTMIFSSSKAAAKQVSPKAKQRRAARPKGASALSAVFFQMWPEFIS